MIQLSENPDDDKVVLEDTFDDDIDGLGLDD